MKSSFFADQMIVHAERMRKEVYSQREEILRAFVAKYGFEPDEAMQIQKKDDNGFFSWFVVRLTPELVQQCRTSVIEERIGREKEKWNWWQRLCLRMANLK